MTSAPVRYSTDVEDVKPDESETIEHLCETFDIILERAAQDSGHAVRSVHAKSHGILEGEITVDADLPDTISLPRGLAIKVVGVEGERMPDAEGATQELIIINGKVFQAKTADAFLKNLKLLARTTDRFEGAKVAASTVLRGVNTALQAVGIHCTKSARSAARRTSIPWARPTTA